jgi:hypothetical protein
MMVLFFIAAHLYRTAPGSMISGSAGAVFVLPLLMAGSAWRDAGDK